MRKIRNECAGFNTDAKKVADDVKKLNARLVEWRKFLEKDKLEKAMERFGELSSERMRLMDQIDKLIAFAEPYFTSLNPHEWKSSFSGAIESNPVEVRIHKSWTLLREAEKFGKEAIERIRNIEVLKRRYAR